MKTPYFYIPKNLMTEEYNSFSGESKLLFGMLLTNAEHVKAISEVANLIDAIGKEDMMGMKHDLSCVTCFEG